MVVTAIPCDATADAKPHRYDETPAFEALMIIRSAIKDDATAILNLFDGAVQWLVDRGLSAQWGTQPFSINDVMVSQVNEWITKDLSFVGIVGGKVSGFICLSKNAPSYLDDLDALIQAGNFFIQGLVADRRLKGCGVGAKLLQYADVIATDHRHDWIYVDCWNGEEYLATYYEGAGYEKVAAFYVGEWQGVLMQKALTQDA